MEAMTSQAVCPKCGGVGWTIVERANVSGAERCACRFEGREQRNEARAKIPARYRDKCLDNFRAYAPYEQELRKLMLGIRYYIEHFDPLKPCPGLLLIGHTGTGKTHLAVAALRGIIGLGFEGLFYNYESLLSSIRKSYDPISDSSDRDAYRITLDTPVLLLDDVGGEKTSQWVQDTVYTIIMDRCDNNKTLIATSNLRDPAAAGVERLEPENGEAGEGGQDTAGPRHGPRRDERDLSRTLEESIGARAYSRLHEMCKVIRMPGLPDYRRREEPRY
jgi:DNA replication protein DnaC